jgi:four helix bundle protein
MTSEELKKRTKQFAIDSALLCEQLPVKYAFKVYSNQLIRASSSVGANYRAACRANSSADFMNKLKIVEEEIDESVFFLELIKEVLKKDSEEVERLLKEGNELTAIFVASINTYRRQQLSSKS